MKLALHGAEPILREDDLPPWPEWGEQEERAVLEVLRSGHWWGVGGSFVGRFEQEFAQKLKVAEAVTVTNGTHALELGLRTLDIGPGDEVLVPALTYISTSMAVMNIGAIPVPVDVDPNTWCMSPAACSTAITDRTRALIPVHFAGHPCAMEELISAAGDLPVFEDAAHAHGGTLSGSALGSIGVMGAFSFQNFKLMTCGEGGALVCSSSELGEKARTIANCGRSRTDQGYTHNLLGSNYRMTELQAAILCQQLNRLEGQSTSRARCLEWLLPRLAEIPGIRPQVLPAEGSRHAGYMVVFTVDGVERDWVVGALRMEGVPAQKIYPCVQKTGHYASALRRIAATPPPHVDCTASDYIADHGVWIHHRVLAADRVAELVVTALERVMGAAS